MSSVFRRISLTRPVPIYTLVWLRIAIGLLGAGDLLGNGIYYHWYLGAYRPFTFSYLGFEWVQPLPAPWLSVFFVVGFLLGLCVALGYRFRVTAPLFALCFTYLFLLEKAHYLNHAYLFTWLAWLLALTPAWREWSLDVRRDPRQWSPVVPGLTLWVFPALMGVVYFFGGINKINHDWLIEAMPLHMWLSNRAGMPLLGPLFALKETAYVMAWGGMLLDLTAPFLLLHRRGRWLALGLLLFFHATNHLIFNIGIFPYLSMVMTSLFFAPDWPLRFVNWLAGRSRIVRRWQTAWRQRIGARPQVPGSRNGGEAAVPADVGQRSRYLVPLLLVLFAVHLLLPIRNHLHPSDVNWSETGHRYAWRMMLRSKQGRGHYRLVDRQTGAEELVYPRDRLLRRQYRKMATHPDMILQYAHHLRDSVAATGRDVAVYADFAVRLNGRRYHPFVDANTDLARVRWNFWGEQGWVLGEGEE